MAGLPPDLEINVDNPGRRIGLEAGCYATFGLAVVFVLVRVYVRTRISRSFGIDDWLVLAGTLMSACFVATIPSQFRNGIGKPATILSPEAFYIARKWSWISEIFYYAALGAIKTSVVVQYHYHAAVPLHKKVILGFGILIFLHGLIAVVITANICHPVSIIWTSPTYPEGCLPLRPFHYFNAGFLILTGFLLTILPIPILQYIQLCKDKKVGLVIAYGIGVLAIVADIARQIININSLWKNDFTWHYAPLVTSSALEINLSLICAAMLALRPLLGGSSTNASSYELDGGATGYNKQISRVGSLGDNAAGYSARIFPTKTREGMPMNNESEERIVPSGLLMEGKVMKSVEYRVDYH